jgi:hypothetical protein
MSHSCLSADILKIPVKRIARKNALRRKVEKMGRQLQVPMIGNAGKTPWLPCAGTNELARSVP